MPPPPPSGRFLHLLYVGAPLDKFLRLLYGPPLRSVSSLTIWPPQINFFAYCVGAPSDEFLRILYRGPPQVSFFAYYGWPPQFSFFAYYMGVPQINLFAYYMGPLGSISSLTIWGPLG